MKNILFFSILITFYACTGNPFWNDNVGPSDGLTLRGKVNLSQENSSDGVYVWMENLDIGVFTDEDGEFDIQLPLPDVQPGGGFTDIFKLYYYLGNYEVVSSTVELLRGKFVYDSYDLDKNGRISQTIDLRKKLFISTSVNPDTATIGDSILIHIAVDLKPNGIPVNVYTFTHVYSGALDGVFFKHQDEPIENAIFIKKSTIFNLSELQNPVQLIAEFHADSMGFKPGQYDIIPYLKIEQMGVPEDLFGSLDESMGAYNYRYLNLPFKRINGHLVIK